MFPSAVVKTPSIFTNNSYSGNYMLTLIDLDVLTNSTGLNLSTPGSLAQGLASNRTTHLHWFVTNVTEDSKGILAPHSGNGSRQVATYAAPSPPKGDINHTYVMFLWNQPKTYTLPKNNTYGTATNTSRNNFSVSALVAKVGNPVAANYFRVSYDNTIKNTTTTSKSAGVMSVKIDSWSTFVVAGFGAVAFAFLL